MLGGGLCLLLTNLVLPYEPSSASADRIVPPAAQIVYSHRPGFLPRFHASGIFAVTYQLSFEVR